MKQKDKLKHMLQYLIAKDIPLANRYFDEHNYELLKEIVDSNVSIIERMIHDNTIPNGDVVLENVRQLQVCMNDFIEQYNIDIPYVDYEEIEYV